MPDAISQQPVEVQARFDSEGQLTPQRFTWRGIDYPVISGGRKWTDIAGQHFMVMAPGEQIYELLFVPQQLRWFLIKGGRTWI